MDQKFKKINHLRQESLTNEEKDLMRGNISSFIDASLNLKSRNTFVQSVMGYMKSGAFVPSLLVILILGARTSRSLKIESLSVKAAENACLKTSL